MANLVKYFIIGGVLTLIEWLIFYVLVYIIGLHYIASSFIAFILISALGIFVYKKMIFGDSKFSFKVEVLAIYLINSIGIVLNTLILWILVDKFSAEVMISKIIASFIVAFYGFFARKICVYK